MDEWFIVMTDEGVRKIEPNTDHRLGYANREEAEEDASFYAKLDIPVTYHVEHRHQCEPEIAIAKILMGDGDG